MQASAGIGFSGALAGRAAECEVFEQALSGLAGGSSQAVEVTGDPGIGKTRLLAEIADRARHHGFLVLDGRARFSEGGVPFYVLIDALDDHLAGLDRNWPEADLSLLSVIFPALRGRHSHDAAAPVERYGLFRAVRALLETLASPGLVLLLDDLQWADEDTAELLTELLRRPPRKPVLLVLAYRWRQAPARLRAAMGVVNCGHRPAFLRLGPLSQAEAETLLAGRGSWPWRRALYRASGGNPFYLDALARSAWGHRNPQTGLPPGLGPDGEELPPAVAAALIAELTALSADGQLAARSAAVIGDEFSTSSVCDVSGLDEDRAVAAVAELAAADLIRPVEPTSLFTFRHALVRCAIYESANPAWRTAAHNRAATALRDAGAQLTTQAHHIERAAKFGDLNAVTLLADAARSVQARAPRTAAQWLRAALRLLPDGKEAQPQRAALLLRLALALGVAGQLQDSRDTLHALLRHLGPAQQEMRIQAVTFCAQIERHLCRRPEAQALLLAELSTLADRDTAAAAALEFELGCGELTAGDPAACRRWAGKALVTVQRRGPAWLLPAAFGLLATTEAILGDARDATEHINRAVSLLDGMLDGELERCLDAVFWVSWGEYFLGHSHSALRHLDRGLTMAHDNGQVIAKVHLLMSRVLVLRETGQLAEASATAEEAVKVTVSFGNEEHQAAALALHCWMAAWTGDPAGVASATAAAAATRWDRSSHSWLAMLTARALSEARLAMGDPAGCLDVTVSAAGSALLGAGWVRTGWHELLTRAELAVGQVAAAARLAESASGTTREMSLSKSTGLALLARAQATTRTDPRAACEIAAAAYQALSGSGMVLDAARATLAGAEAQAARGDLDRAFAEARAAQSAFESCSAMLFARAAARLRRRIAATGSRSGHGGHHSAAPGRLTPLTRREHQVAALISQGLTNRRTAERLHVTEKTIEMHLSNIYAKLGVSSRTEAAAVLLQAAAKSLRLAPPSRRSQPHRRSQPILACQASGLSLERLGYTPLMLGHLRRLAVVPLRHRQPRRMRRNGCSPGTGSTCSSSAG